MFRPLLICLAIVVSACGPLGPPKSDGGLGGGTGGGLFFGGGTGGSGGGSGGGVTGGGTGGGTTGGGTGAGATGGGAGGGATGGGGGALAPLTWASMSISGATSTSYIIGLSGAVNDVWAAQDTGSVFHSTGAAFSLQFPIQNGVKALYAAGGTVVIVQTRSIRTCTANCTTETAFADFQLLNGTYNLFGEAVCGRGPNDITVIVSDTQNAGQVFHWNGTAWTRTDTNLGVSYPRSCWFDATGALYVVGQDAVVRSDMGANTVDTLSTNFMTYYGGADVAGTPWVVGASHYIARRTAPATWTRFPLSTSSTLWTVGGLSANEVYAFGYWDSAVGNGFKWNGTALTPVGSLLPNTGTQSTIRTMLLTAPNELYVAGSNQSGPIIIRGRR